MTAIGSLAVKGDCLYLKIAGTDQRLRLDPLVHAKVQWDPRTKRPFPATLQEQNACKELALRMKKNPGLFRVIGPIVGADKNGPPVMEVREFAYLLKS